MRSIWTFVFLNIRSLLRWKEERPEARNQGNPQDMLDLERETAPPDGKPGPGEREKSAGVPDQFGPSQPRVMRIKSFYLKGTWKHAMTRTW
jgi:hypothetical protein